MYAILIGLFICALFLERNKFAYLSYSIAQNGSTERISMQNSMDVGSRIEKAVSEMKRVTTKILLESNFIGRHHFLL